MNPRSPAAADARTPDRRPAVLVYVTFEASGEVRGGPRSMLLTARHLQRYQPIFVVNTETSYVDDVRAAGLGVHVLPIPRILTGIRTARWSERLDRVRRVVRHDLELVDLARRHDARILHCQDPAEALMAGAAAKISGRNVVLHVRDQPSRSGGLRLAHLLVAGIADRVIFISEPLRQAWLHATPPALRPLGEQRTLAIPNGIDFHDLDRRSTDRTAALAALGLPAGSWLVSVVGPLEQKKNQLAFLEQCARPLLALGPDVRLAFVGSERAEPSYAARCRAAAAALGAPDRILFLGELPHARMWDVHAANRVLAIPSLVEGLPRTALEAQAMACPVVASDTPGNAAAIVEGQTGFLVSLARLAEASERIARLRDPALRARFSAAARAHARRSFDVLAVTPRIEAVYDQLLDAGRAGAA